jgi:hypothetical protein
MTMLQNSQGQEGQADIVPIPDAPGNLPANAKSRRGGKRPGAGRPKGSKLRDELAVGLPRKLVQRAAVAAGNAGLLPSEFLSEIIEKALAETSA